MEAEFQQTLLQSQLEIQEQTLRHISWELHDNLSQAASLIKINLNTLKLDDIDKALRKIEDTKDITRQLITDLKTLSVSLGSDKITQSGLAAAVSTELDRLNRTGQYETSFKQEGSLPSIATDKAIILYRMVQETLNNSVKHSDATSMDVFFTSTENLFTLAISDNGSGFDVDEKRKNGGSGLLNLQNRAKLINATLTLESSPGQGTRVTIELPI